MVFEAFHGVFWNKGTFWVTIAVIIFVILYGRKILKFVTDMLDQRSADIRRELDAATRLRAEAEAMLRDAEARRTEATKQAEAMIAFAAGEAERVAAELMHNAEDAAKRRERMATDRIAAAEAEAVGSVRQAAASLATRTVEIVLRETLGAERDAALIDHAIAAVPSALTRRAA